MNVDALLALRAEIDTHLADRRRDLEKQLSRLGVGGGRAPVEGRAGRGRRGSSLKGIKVAPKYRGPEGETWAGRGAQPRWLTALLKQGHKIDEFAVSRGRSKKGPRKG
jgi:DNA-binding protein H-NS